MANGMKLPSPSWLNSKQLQVFFFQDNAILRKKKKNVDGQWRETLTILIDFLL